jgi:competence ComEA-like helix-hairpin-helix protein
MIRRAEVAADGTDQIRLSMNVAAPLRSFLLKLGLLAIAVSLVLWIGWPTDNTLDRRPAGTSEPPNLLQHEQVTPLKHDTASAEATQHGPLLAKLDLNEATSAQLQALPGIGEALAQRVIDRRHAKGRFQTVDDLLEVKGIGPKRLKQLRPLLTIGHAAPSTTARRPPPHPQKRL